MTRIRTTPHRGSAERRPRRGRPPEAERDQRRAAALDAALAELADSGYDALTMLAVARRAGSSKESLYAWFGSKEGLFAALIRRESAATDARVRAALDTGGDPRQTLLAISSGLQELLLGTPSLAINRAALAAPALAELLLATGRHTTGPLVESYLAELHRAGVIVAPDTDEAFRLLYGLVIQDAQIRALLGERPVPRADRGRRAGIAVDRFLALTAPVPG